MTVRAADPSRLQRLQLSLQLYGMLGMGAGMSIAVTSSLAGALTSSGHATAGRIVIAAALLPCCVALWAVLRMMKLWDRVVAELDAQPDEQPATGDDAAGAGTTDPPRPRSCGPAEQP